MKLVDLVSNISSIENNVNICIGKSWTAINNDHIKI